MVAASRMVGSQEEALPSGGHGRHAASPVSKDHLSQLTGDNDLAPMCHKVAKLGSAARETARIKRFCPLLLLAGIADTAV